MNNRQSAHTAAAEVGMITPGQSEHAPQTPQTPQLPATTILGSNMAPPCSGFRACVQHGPVCFLESKSNATLKYTMFSSFISALFRISFNQRFDHYSYSVWLEANRVCLEKKKIPGYVLT